MCVIGMFFIESLTQYIFTILLKHLKLNLTIPLILSKMINNNKCNASFYLLIYEHIIKKKEKKIQFLNVVSI